MTIEECSEIKYYKKEIKTVAHYEDMASKKILRLRFCFKGQKYEKKKGYAKIGIEKAKEELETHFEEQMKLLNPKTIVKEGEIVYSVPIRM
jgi:hypothetical protein